MKVLLFILFSVFFSTKSLAQKEAFNWVWGVCTEGNPCEGKFGTSIIKFNDDSIERIYNPGYFGGQFYLGTSTISDSLGNLLMVFNGKTLFDSVGNQLAEMNDLPIGQFSIGFKSFLFLKLKTEIPIYYLLYNYSYSLDIPINDFLIRGDFNIIKVGIRTDSTGYSILLNDTITFDTPNFPGHIEATRHANGRDWWVLKSGMRRNSFVRGVLSPDGLSFEDFTTDADGMYNNAQIWHAFSADGSKFFHFMGNSIRILDVYDFDRCTGELSNLRTFNFSNKVNADDFTPFNLSPDGNKLFMLRTNYATMQSYQNLEFDINTGEFHDMIDGPSAPCLTPNLQQILFGNYKYNEDKTFEPYIGVLNNPNEFSDNSNFIPYERPFPTWGYLRIPHNWANHMLGPVDGSSCDTLGLDQDYTLIKAIEESQFNIFPNPGVEVLNFSTTLPLPLQVNLRDAQGKLVLEKTFTKPGNQQNIATNALPAGIYFVEVMNHRYKKRFVRRWMKMVE